MGYDIGSTHIPVLVALGLTRPIHRVLELGAGLYSTPTFLNRKVFPQLEQLVSVEDDLNWQLKVQRGCPDTRLMISGTIPSLTDPYDLIFVDNSTDLKVRAATIRRVAEETRDGLVRVHDRLRSRHMRHSSSVMCRCTMIGSSPAAIDRLTRNAATETPCGITVGPPAAHPPAGPSRW